MKKLDTTLPPLDSLRAFEILSRNENLSLVSSELDQPIEHTIKQIDLLEKHLGISLFVRNDHLYSLTAEGVFFSEQLRLAHTIILNASKSLKEAYTKITISVPPTFASKWIIPRLHNFYKAYPKIDLQVYASAHFCNFEKENIDIAIRYGKPPFDDMLNYELLATDLMISVISPKVFNNQMLLDLPTFIQNSTLLHDKLNEWPNYLLKLGIISKPSNNLFFPQTSLAIDAAIDGHGIALCHRLFVKKELEMNQLTQVFSPPHGTDNMFYIVYPKTTNHYNTIQKIKDWIKHQI